MSAQELRDALSGPRGALDMYLECHDEQRVRADILALTGDEERRRVAAMAMQGLLAKQGGFGSHYNGAFISDAAVKHADALLATLQRPQRGEGE